MNVREFVLGKRTYYSLVTRLTVNECIDMLQV
jgi:hypothetical protein